jgi:hypothetical protein
MPDRLLRRELSHGGSRGVPDDDCVAAQVERPKLTLTFPIDASELYCHLMSPVKRLEAYQESSTDRTAEARVQ